MKLLKTASVFLTFFLAGAVQATVVDFSGEPAGLRDNGFVSGGITFNDTNGDGLVIVTDLPGTCGTSANTCLANFGDDPGALEMIFNGSFTSLSLDFGNDQSGFIPEGGLALLQLFLNGVQVGEASTVVNGDDIMNQTVSYSGAAFNSAIFAYTDSNGNRINLAEVVDNITYDGNATDLPEPASLALLGVAMAGMRLVRRRK
jgi:hypothetical protein